MKKAGGLNVGLESLLGDLGQEVLNESYASGLKELSIDQLQAGQFQPRRHFSEESLNELALSIAEHGIIQPLVVRKLQDECYEIIAGERRYRAAQQAGLSKVPCVVKLYDDQQALAVALIENLQRSDLNALEVAQSLQKLLANFKLAHEKIAQLVGRSRSSVTNYIRLLDLSDSVQEAILDNAIEMGHARALLALNEAGQKYLLNVIKQKKLTVRQTEAKVKEMLSEAPVKIKNNDIEIEHLQSALSQYMGYSVAINPQGKGKGKITLKYNNLDELDGILAKWGYKNNK